LLVGHTDTSADPAYNDPLSLERADAVAQYLQEDFNPWLKRYDSSVAQEKRWSKREDVLMISNFPGFDTLQRPICNAGQRRWRQHGHQRHLPSVRAEFAAGHRSERRRVIDGFHLASSRFGQFARAHQRRARAACANPRSLSPQYVHPARRWTTYRRRIRLEFWVTGVRGNTADLPLKVTQVARQGDPRTGDGTVPAISAEFPAVSAPLGRFSFPNAAHAECFKNAPFASQVEQSVRTLYGMA
jgi:hypothetical protein